jgi:hypothetical protein
LEFGADFQLDIAGELESFLEVTLASVQELVTGDRELDCDPLGEFHRREARG